ncbi:MAG: hypothetical protein KC656_19125, partial [Myxococcales bacterium]|nr:hypothetical protein [Myxococcales bacterium]
MILFVLPVVLAQDTFFVNVKSSQWNVVFRSSIADTRIERMAAKCGEGWINVCSSWVAPDQRQAAFQAGLTPNARMMGNDYSSCRELRLPRMDAATLQRDVLQRDARAFCEVLKPGSTALGLPGEPAFRDGSGGGMAASLPAPNPGFTTPTPSPGVATPTP